MSRPIAIGISPNAEFDDVILAFKTLFRTNSMVHGHSKKMLEAWFRKTYSCKKVFLFNSGRTALYSVLKSFGIGTGDEVIIQGFTCVAVPDAVIWTGAVPVYSDIGSDLNIDPGLLQSLITSKTRAIIVQHTFGMPAQIELIKKIAQYNKIILIEDCAHSLGMSIKGKPAGQFGDASFFSFGRDKIVSAVFGGAAIINKGNEKAAVELERIYGSTPEMKTAWVIKQLLHPVLFFLILPFYNLGPGKLMVAALKKMNILSVPVEKEELKGGIPSFMPGILPNALAVLALNQLKKLHKFNDRRREISQLYYRGLGGLAYLSLPPKNSDSVFMRFNVVVDNRDGFYRFFRKKGIILGLWYSNIIDPKGSDFGKIGYKKGRLPKAEFFAEKSLNLPTYPLLKNADVEKIIRLLKVYGNNKN